MLIDTHAHLTMSEFNDLPQVMDRAREAGVSTIINAGFDLESSIKAVDLTKQYEMMFSAVGIHPHHADSVNDSSINRLEELSKNKKVVAIGETGLDYYENPMPKELQKKAFEGHINLAKKLNLPMIFHGRQSGDDILDILKANKEVKGVFHCFSEDVEYARKALDMGFFISFTGIITFKNADKMREVVSYVPISSIMVETDCPYLTPQLYRGKRNEPSYVKIVAEKVAEIKQITFEQVCEITSRNANNLFGVAI